MINPFRRKQPIQQPPLPKPRRVRDDCKIKIKKSGDTKTITFSGNCSKEKLLMAKEMSGADKIEEE